MGYIGLLFALAGALALWRTRDRPRYVVGWALVVSILLQSISCFAFSGILMKKSGLLFVLLGLIAGLAAGNRLRLSLDGKRAQYRDSLWFTVPYMAILLLNQIIALFLHAFLPAMLFLAALAFGLQTGCRLRLLARSRKLQKAAGVLAAGLIVSALLLPVSAAERAQSFQIISDYPSTVNLYHAMIFASEIDLAYEPLFPEGTYPHTASGTLNVDLPETLDELRLKLDVTVDYFGSGDMVMMIDDWKGGLGFQIPEGCAVPIGADGGFSGTVQVRQYSRVGNGEPASTYVDWLVSGSVGADGCRLTLTQDNGNTLSYLIAYPPGSAPAGLESGAPPAETPAAGDPGGADGGQPADDAGGSTPENEGGQTTGAEESGPARDTDGASASAASAAGGIPAGLSALLSLIGLVGPGGAQSAGGAPTAPPTPPTRPVPGTRGADGRIYTKNHGWQNEFFPEQQAQSLQSSIRELQRKLTGYREGSILAEVTRDMLREEQLRLRQWTEDASLIRRTRGGENEALNRRSAERWAARDAQLEDLSSKAELASFAGDLALAAATSGSSVLFAGAKSLGTVRTALRTVSALSTAKEVAGSAANVYDNYLKDKNLASALAKEGVNYAAGKGAGKLFEKGRELAGFQKYGPRKAADSLKLLCSSGETWGTSELQRQADELGLTDAASDAAKSARDFFGPAGGKGGR